MGCSRITSWLPYELVDPAREVSQCCSSIATSPASSAERSRSGAGKLSATTYITFEDVEVPAEYLIGTENQGFKLVMSNFNHERLWIVFQALRGARICLQDAMSWALKREVFGMTLIEQPVVRHKFGIMVRSLAFLRVCY